MSLFSNNRATITLMPTEQILSMLLAERDRLDQAIAIIQGTRSAPSPKPATPAANTAPAAKTRSTLNAAPTQNASARKRPVWTPAMRRAASERAKAAYAERMKKSGKKS
jgi:pyruvate/2-oxoglutarate dehydrogenase complex dihydrolipoamide acyltransferase (E2) component